MTMSEGSKQKREYTRPVVEEFGTVADLTQLGFTNPGDDCLVTGQGRIEGGSNHLRCD
jgi:hypothetical protein